MNRIKRDSSTIDFKNSIFFDFNHTTNTIDSFTQKYNSTYKRHISKYPLTPFELPKSPCPTSSSSAETGAFDPSEIDENFYYVRCKSKKGIFYPNLFCRGNVGKSIFVSSNQNHGELWLTPIEFKIYSGNCNNNWSEAIHLEKANYFYEKNKLGKHKYKYASQNDEWTITFRSLIESDQLKVHHDCPHDRCLFAFNQYLLKSTKLLSSLLVNSANDLVFIYPNSFKRNVVEISVNNRRADGQRTNNIENLCKDYSYARSHFINSESTKRADHVRFEINQLETTIFNDEVSYFDPTSARTSCNEAHLSVNFGDRILKSYRLEFNENDLRIKSLSTVDFSSVNKRISCISNSKLIRYETAVLVGDEIYLIDEELEQVNFDSMPKLASNLNPLFHSDHFNWHSIQFGNQPRKLIYSDCTQVLAIDSRLRSSPTMNDLFRPIQAHLEPNEIVYRTKLIENNYSMCALLCSDSLVLLDERFVRKPLFKWKHCLEWPGVFLENSYLLDEKHCSPSNLIIIGNTHDDFYMYESSDLSEVKTNPSTKDSRIISSGFTRKMDKTSERLHDFGDVYDKRYARYLNVEFGKPNLAVSLLKLDNSLAFFKLKTNNSLFYELLHHEDEKTNRSSSINDQFMPKLIKKYTDEKRLNDHFPAVDSVKQGRGKSRQRKGPKRPVHLDKLSPGCCEYCLIAKSKNIKPKNYCEQCCLNQTLDTTLTSEKYDSACGDESLLSNLAQVWNLIDLNSIDMQKQTLTNKLHSIFN